jgi:hypothetical protein
MNTIAVKAVKSGNLLETPMSYITKWMLGVFAASGFCVYANRVAFNVPPPTLDPEWIADSAKHGPIAVSGVPTFTWCEWAYVYPGSAHPSAVRCGTYLLSSCIGGSRGCSLQPQWQQQQKRQQEEEGHMGQQQQAPSDIASRAAAGAAATAAPAAAIARS